MAGGPEPSPRMNPCQDTRRPRGRETTALERRRQSRLVITRGCQWRGCQQQPRQGGAGCAAGAIPVLGYVPPTTEWKVCSEAKIPKPLHRRRRRQPQQRGGGSAPVVEVRVPRGPGAVEGKGELLVVLVLLLRRKEEWCVRGHELKKHSATPNPRMSPQHCIAQHPAAWPSRRAEWRCRPQHPTHAAGVGGGGVGCRSLGAFGAASSGARGR